MNAVFLLFRNYTKQSVCVSVLFSVEISERLQDKKTRRATSIIRHLTRAWWMQKRRILEGRCQDGNSFDTKTGGKTEKPSTLSMMMSFVYDTLKHNNNCWHGHLYYLFYIV